MATLFKVNKTKNYTVMCNYHLRDKTLSFKAKGLLSFMLSLPKNWDYSMKGLVSVSKENIQAIRTMLHELEEHKYKIGDDVKLSTSHYLHGIGNNEKIADFIAEHGILSKEATGDLGNHAFQFVVGLWKVIMESKK